MSADECKHQDRRDALGVLLVALVPLLALAVIAIVILFWIGTNFSIGFD